MEAATGQVIYEKDADTVLAPASITKIMTLILIFEAIEDGSINMEDPVTVSEYAASMGGSAKRNRTRERRMKLSRLQRGISN